jgi:hypothetical protein
VGNELGLTARFVRNVGEAVNRALSVSDVSNLRFGDVHLVALADTKFPGVVLLGIASPIPGARGNLVAVEELKTFWTIRLELMPVNSPLSIKKLLEHPIG